jgi:hypothetical protein
MPPNAPAFYRLAAIIGIGKVAKMDDRAGAAPLSFGGSARFWCTSCDLQKPKGTSD